MLIVCLPHCRREMEEQLRRQRERLAEMERKQRAEAEARGPSHTLTQPLFFALETRTLAFYCSIADCGPVAETQGGRSVDSRARSSRGCGGGA
jgi:hypothetical protein